MHAESPELAGVLSDLRERVAELKNDVVPIRSLLAQVCVRVLCVRVMCVCVVYTSGRERRKILVFAYFSDFGIIACMSVLI